MKKSLIIISLALASITASTATFAKSAETAPNAQTNPTTNTPAQTEQYEQFDTEDGVFQFPLTYSPNPTFTTPYGTFNADGELLENSKQALEKLSFDETLAKAKAGENAAQLQLAKMYHFGIHTKTNLKQAVHWYSQSAEQNNHHAQNNLAVLYSTGDGVSQDDQKAIALWTQASQTVPHAKTALAMYQLEKDPNDKAALKTLEDLANENFLPAQFSLGYHYLNILEDEDKGTALITQSAENGLTAAQGYLAERYTMNLLLTLDVGERIRSAKKAYYWAGRGCQNGNKDACNLKEYWHDTFLGMQNLKQSGQSDQTPSTE